MYVYIRIRTYAFMLKYVRVYNLVVYISLDY